MRAACVGAGLVALCLSACVPFPHRERIGSELLGRVFEKGWPLVGLRVKRVLGGSKCSSAGDEVVTDGAGQFAFAAVTRFEAATPVYGDPWAPITLCAQRDNEWIVLLDRSYLGSEPPEHMQIVCEVRPDAPPGQMCVENIIWWPPTPPTPITDPNYSIGGMTLLVLAAGDGDLATTKQLLADGADPNLKTDVGLTALLVAIRARHDDVALALLAAGADPNETDDSRRTPWVTARDLRDETLMRALENAGAIPATPVPYTPLPLKMLRP